MLLTHPDWKALIQQAESRSAITLACPLENYLSNLMQRFIRESTLGQQVMAMAWLESRQTGEVERYLRVGDECLILAGLFPDHLKRRSLGLHYYIQLGRTAYAALSHHTSDLYGALSTDFVALTDVLYYVRANAALPPFEAYQRFQDSGSLHAKALLEQYVRIIPLRRS